ncbi:dihydrolipoyl dehydrogenase family protein [Cerasicoccus frondis]|uniref:dihydrolipoyl dehydrogenase family protein n=1 Tax=Cerasicoccus frondis TaxID=490090 RepID=UPI002852A5CC|nr:FAD-dependent oxidoreductase [Cerasicoccus frondis]
MKPYKNIVIGSGEGGKFLAWTLAAAGQSTVVVERSMIGGACPNVACLPSKNLIYSAKVASLMKRGDEFGLPAMSGAVNMHAVIARKKAMVEGLVAMHLDRFKSSGAELMMGEARFLDAKALSVTTHDAQQKIITGERIFINVGTHASVPDVPGLKNSRPLTHVEALNLENLPKHLVILGGGYVGLEFAQALARFGSKVTLLQHGVRLLEKEDDTVSTAMLDLMKNEGVDVILGCEITEVRGQSGSSVAIDYTTRGQFQTIAATDILVATGRTPNTASLNANAAGIELDTRGYICVDPWLRTSAPDIWALGDCAGTPHFTHASLDDFRIVKDQLLGPGLRTTDNRNIPFCLFTDPELVRIGLSEHEAIEQGLKYRKLQIPAEAILRTRTLSATRGFVSALIDENERILGFTAFCADASELLAAVQIMMALDAPITAIRDLIFTHPTKVEGLGSLFAQAVKEDAVAS